MLKVLKFILNRNCIITRKYNNSSICRQIGEINLRRNHLVHTKSIRLQNNTELLRRPSPITYFTRDKYSKKKSAGVDEELDSDDETVELEDERDSKIVKTSVNSLRLDLLIKAGLQIARNKVEAIFYDSKIRVNGKKIPKKSIQMNIGDEIDVIRGFSNLNPEHLIVSRIVIVSVTKKEENLSVNLRRYKNLIIENYEGTDAYKSSGD